MSARKRQRRAVISESDSDSDIPSDGGLQLLPARRGRLRRAGKKAAAAAEDVIDLGLRQRVANSRKAPQRAALERLQRLRSGGGALEDSSGNDDDGALSSGGSGSGGSAREEQAEGEGSEQDLCSSSDADAGFIATDDDEEGVEAAMQELRGITGGSSMDESGRFQLYAQLRLLHMLGALPRAASLSSEVKKCISTATGTERNLLQYGVQSQNLEHWRRSDPGLQARFEEYALLETEEGGYRWGKHCSYCRHDRNHKMPMLLLHFRGRRQPVAFLEPILAQRGLLPSSARGAAGDQGTPMGAHGSDQEDSSGPSGASSSSSEDDEPLSVGYKRRQALRMQQARQAERAQHAQQRRQQAGTPLRARQVARQLAAAGDSSSEEDSLLGGAALARHAAQQRRPLRHRRRGLAFESSDDEQQQQQQAEEEEDEGPASRDGGSSQRQEGAAGEGSEGAEWSQGIDPDPSDSSGSEMGKRPRRCPRIGTDCWARAYVYRAIHRAPARLDAMLLYCTRRFLARTPEAEQPCSLAGLAHAVLERYGHALTKHYNQFMYSINSFNLLQNRKKDRSFANSCIVNELQELQYAQFTALSPEEELWGVNIEAELARFTTGARQRAQQRLVAAAAAAAGGHAAAAAEEEGADEECGRLLLLRAAGGGGDAASSEEEGGEGDVHYAAEEQPEEEAEPGQRRRRTRKQRQQQERLETPLLQRRRPAAQQGGQRAAAAIAAAAADCGRQGGGPGKLWQEQGAAGRAVEQPVSEQRQQQQQQRQQGEAPRDRNACFFCGATGHWSAACPERQRCFHCKEIG
ncbi:hypothetical protein COHA_010199 [Chlorella ohadii]|uniref:CCHC-type domain-containing protein n=1 Tax=Chlorella ohadii TaxID=2649997 RepID=A0AAD5DKC2_9CHLO|nr:hypothetical protein COHA_010199 [Chlorella ohadii]